MKTYSISEAKQKLGQLADEALSGEEILIVRKSKILVIKPAQIEVISSPRPAGFFQDCYDKHDEKISKSIAKRGPQAPVL